MEKFSAENSGMFPKCELFQQVQKFWEKNDMNHTLLVGCFFWKIWKLLSDQKFGLNFQEWDTISITSGKENNLKKRLLIREFNNTQISTTFTRGTLVPFTLGDNSGIFGRMKSNSH